MPKIRMKAPISLIIGIPARITPKAPLTIDAMSQTQMNAVAPDFSLRCSRRVQMRQVGAAAWHDVRCGSCLEMGFEPEGDRSAAGASAAA
jgi:hypothetical protein